MSFVDGFLNLFKVQDDEFDVIIIKFIILNLEKITITMKNLMMTKMMISLQQERSFFQVLRSQMMKIHQLHLQ